jgi:hypothetical protein
VLAASIDLADARGVLIGVPFAGRHVELPYWGWYSVRGWVNGVASDWFQFEVVPNPCGGCIRLPKPPAPKPTPQMPQPPDEPWCETTQDTRTHCPARED